MSEDDESVGTVFQALSRRRRRVALGRLQTHGTMSLADLAELVAEREAETDIVELSPEEVRDVYFSLYHKHLPVLVEAGLADYDQDGDLVSVTDRTDSALTVARETLDSLIDE